MRTHFNKLSEKLRCGFKEINLFLMVASHVQVRVMVRVVYILW